MASLAAKVYAESGLHTLITSPRDVKLLCLQRLMRMFSFGATTLVLTLYLIGLGNTHQRVGLFMTLTLLGDVVTSLAMTVVADRVGRRNILRLGASLMVGSGVVFALSDEYWIFVLASVVGIISPAGNEIGPFKAIEESILTQLVDPMDRSTALAWYTMSGTAGAAIGTVLFGFVVGFLHDHRGWGTLDSYRLVFWLYAAVGVLEFFIASMLAPNCEAVKSRRSSAARGGSGEQQPLLGPDAPHEPESDVQARTEPEKNGSRWKALLPDISATTAVIITKLCVLFVMDAFGSGIASQSWLIYFFHTKFHMEEEQLGSLFFITNVLSSLSNLVAAALARRIGLVQTMVFSHLPASAALLALPFPADQGLSIGLLVFRAAITSMDQAPRQAFLAAVVLPEERTTVMGIVNVVKILAQSAGPLVTGSLADGGNFGYAFVLAGALKIGYDVLMSALFMSHKPREESMKEEEDGSEAAGEEAHQHHPDAEDS